MIFAKCPGVVTNEVINAVNWDTVVFYSDPLTGIPQMAEQKMIAPPKNPFGVDMGGLQGGKAASVECDLDKIRAKGVPPLTYGEVKKIFEISSTKKIALGAAAIELKGREMFMPQVYDRFMGNAPTLVYGWYDGCQAQTQPETPVEAPMTGKMAGQARRRLVQTDAGFVAASAATA